MRQQYDHGREHHHREFSGTHVSLGSVKCAAGAVALMLLGERIKNPEQRYLLLAGLSAAIGGLDTMWRDHVRAKEREDKEACWRERYERECDRRDRERA
jgi:hypothetical protein